MLFLISEAKTQKVAPHGTTEPLFILDALSIFNKLAKLNVDSIKELYHISDKKALEVYNYYRKYEGKQTAIYSYQGLVFQYLKSSSWSNHEFDFASKHIFILSALYGILRITDSISLHRLDFKTKLDTNLYSYWTKKITEYLVSMNQTIINLASDEYSKVVKAPMINIVFSEFSNGKYINKPTYSKINRGKMLNIIVKSNIDTLDDLKSVTFDGYKFDSSISDESNLHFTKRIVDNNFI